VERVEDVSVVFDHCIRVDVKRYGWMGNPFVIDVKDPANDISHVAVLQEQLIEIHKDETLRNNYLKETISNETPIREDKALEGFTAGVPKLATTEASMLIETAV
jgi:hypothetical protein